MGELSEPPFRGIVESTQDALLLLEAARRGIIPRVSRRFTEKERALIQSGAIFIFHEEESKIKRWTDGLVWSPSRILGNFLIYRELEKRDRSGKNTSFSSVSEAKTRPASSGPGLTVKTGRPPSRATSTQDGLGGGMRSPATSVFAPTAPHAGPSHQAARASHSFALGPDDLPPDAYPPQPGDDGYDVDMRPYSQGSQQSTGAGGFTLITSETAEELSPAERRERKQRERQLVGSLTASFRFKEKGLIKKTMSMTINGYSQHLISYYSLEDALCGRLRSPSTLPELSSLEIGSEFLDPDQFRFPPKTQIGPDGLLRYRGEPDMQEDTPEELSTSKPLPAASSSSSAAAVRRRSSPPSLAAGPSTSSAYADVKPTVARPGSSSSRPLSSPNYPTAPSSASYSDPSPIAPPPQSFPRRPSSPPTYVSGPSSGSYPARSGRMYHPYASGPTDYSDPTGGGGPRYADGGRRPSLRGQYSFDGSLPIDVGRPMSASYSAGPSPLDPPTAAAGYALPPGYGPPQPAVAPYPPSPRSSTYPHMPATYPIPSPYQPSPYEPYMPTAPTTHQQPTYYDDSPGQSPVEGPPSGGGLRQSQPVHPPPHHYHQSPSAAYYQPPARSSASDPYAPMYPSADSAHVAPPSMAPPQPYYPTYGQSGAPPPPPDAGLGVFNPPTFNDGGQAPVYRQAPPVRQQQQQGRPPPPPPPDGHPPYTGWGYGD